MPETEFWKLVDVLGGSTDDDAVERLTGVLRAGGRKQAVAFQERLAATLFDLDREVLFRQGVRFVDDPPDAAPIPLSSDSFLYLRAGIVAKGRQVVEQVLADPAVLTASQWEECEVLLYAAEEAVGEEIETAVSYETGENEQHWPPPTDDPTEHRTPSVLLLLSDPLDPSYAPDDAGSTPAPRPEDMLGWPMWFPVQVFVSTMDFANESVHGSGEFPAATGPTPVQVRIDLGERWRLAPEVGRVPDPFGRGEAAHVRVEMRRHDLRSWQEPQQATALQAVVARCLLEVLPDGHPGRPALQEAVSAGAALLPATG